MKIAKALAKALKYGAIYFLVVAYLIAIGATPTATALETAQTALAVSAVSFIVLLATGATR